MFRYRRPGDGRRHCSSSRGKARRCVGQCLPVCPPFRAWWHSGHQAVHHVSFSPSKIPYGGFSPVRLQAGRRRQPSPPGRRPRGLICRPSPSGPSGPRRGSPSSRDGQSPHWVGVEAGSVRAHRPRGPWLGVGLCCPVASSLTTASSALLGRSRRLIVSSGGSSPQGPGPRRSLLLAANPSRRATSRTPADRAAWDDSTSARNSLRPNARGSASATSHLNRNTWVPFRGCRIRLMLRPDELLALLRQGRLRSSFRPASRLAGTSNMTTRANRQSPAAGLSPAGFAALQAAPHSGHRPGVARRS